MAEEFALLSWLFLSPIFLILILMHRHGLFFDRYCVASQVAILVALTIFLADRVQLNRWAAYAVSAVLVLAIVRNQVWEPLLRPAPQITGVLGTIQPNLPIVVSEGQVFMEMNQWEKARVFKQNLLSQGSASLLDVLAY